MADFFDLDDYREPRPPTRWENFRFGFYLAFKRRGDVWTSGFITARYLLPLAILSAAAYLFYAAEIVDNPKH